MTKNLKIYLAQLNFIVGDLEGNCAKILCAYQKASEQGADLAVFSELAICGYPPEDLLLKKYFLDEINEKIEEIKNATLGKKCAILFGVPTLKEAGLSRGIKPIATTDLYNSAIVIEDGEIIKTAHKTCLPNYGVFDEHRYFKAAPVLSNFEFRGFRLVILICEDIWHLKNAFLLGDKEFDAIISINASPFSFDKFDQRLTTVRKFIKDLQKPVFYVNQVGGQDSLVFDGTSFVMDEDGEIVLQAKEFEEDSLMYVCHPEHSEGYRELVLSASHEILRCAQDDKVRNAQDDKYRRIYNALILGLRDYIHKNGFKNVLIGMSGGIDSALVAAIAVDALGSENVKLVALPSKFNSDESMRDALQAAENLGVKLEIINIENSVLALNEALCEQFTGLKIDTTEENIQSRIRGNILMALSNKFGNLLLSTGNKSEMATGYATLYGDMCGAFNPLKDVYKTEVFELAKWRNKNIPCLSVFQKGVQGSPYLGGTSSCDSRAMGVHSHVIPENIIQKEPTAELRANQKDSDSLPPYEILDKILFMLIEEQKSVKEIIKLGFDKDLVEKIFRLFHNSEYKRAQAVLGVKVSNRSFDRDRRYPITNHFKS